MTGHDVVGWARYRTEGPSHACVTASGRTWCGLPGPAAEDPAPTSEGRVCQNCQRALRRGTPFRLDGRLDTYTVFSVYPNFAHVTSRRARWREGDRARWRAHVRAFSRKQAHYLATNGIESTGPGEPGIVEIREPGEALR